MGKLIWRGPPRCEKIHANTYRAADLIFSASNFPVGLVDLGAAHKRPQEARQGHNCRQHVPGFRSFNRTLVKHVSRLTNKQRDGLRRGDKPRRSSYDNTHQKHRVQRRWFHCHPIQNLHDVVRWRQVVLKVWLNVAWMFLGANSIG